MVSRGAQHFKYTKLLTSHYYLKVLLSRTIVNNLCYNMFHYS